MTVQEEVRLRTALEGAFVCTMDPPRIDDTEDAFRLTRAILTGMGLDVDVELRGLRARGGLCDDEEVLLNCQLGGGA